MTSALRPLRLPLLAPLTVLVCCPGVTEAAPARPAPSKAIPTRTATAPAPPLAPRARPAGIVDLRAVVPDVALDIRYFTPHNFVGRPIPGYFAPKCLLTTKAARALATVQARLRPMGLSLKIYDCYRPQRAVDAFAAWARDLDDKTTKTEFYPKVDKRELFSKGYIALRSSHSRGSTVDLTIVPVPAPAQPAWDPRTQVECFRPAPHRFADNGLDMGGGFDCFGPVSHTENRFVPPQQRANRLLLRSLMDRAGFQNLAEEWWHYTLRDEPYPNTYFDFVVK